MEETVEKGIRIILLGDEGQKVPVRAEEGTRRVAGIGVFDTGALIGALFGAAVNVGNRRFIVLRPSVMDNIETLRRKPQIVLPKDSAHIIMNCDISSGRRVVEAGSGTGALTVVIANAVMPGGRVFSYDIRPEHLDVARENIASVGLEEACEFRAGDVCEPGGILQSNVDATVFDIPEPWRAIDNAWDALRPCGHFACYSPTVNQVELTMRALMERRFIEVRTVETLQREMTVVEKGIRPSFEMLGHSGYLTFARKVLEKL
jgi:tRNA (adenine57-N1/adenine58-N1)-methyltransferase